MGFPSIERFLFPILSLVSICFFSKSALAQSFGNPIIPPPQPPAPAPSPLPPPDELLPLPDEPRPVPEIPRNIPGTIRVNRFVFEGNTVFPPAELERVTRPFTGRSISFTELLSARSAVTQLYVDNGYVTSGAYIPPQTLDRGIVRIKIVEGSLEDMRITVQGRLNSDYIRARVAIATGKPLNINRLIEALQVLQLDPLITRVSARLEAGTRPGTNLLDVTVEAADTFRASAIFDNGRNPAVGSFRRGVQVEENSLTGRGDRLRAWYLNTDGSNDLAIAYSIPVNAYDGTLSLEYRNVTSAVIQEPLKALDLESDYQDWVLSFRQPVTRSPNQELAFGATLEVQRSQSWFLQGQPFIVYGTNNQGVTGISTLRLFQEWTGRGREEVLFLRSEFSMGLDLFNPTTPFDSQINSNAPRSDYFLWRGQGQWVRQLAPDTLFVLRGNLQFADGPLVPLEQFALGGLYSVRGYQQNFLLTDNGFFASAELRIPIFRAPRQQQLVQIIPFLDTGVGWNNPGIPDPDPQTLLSVGLGLNWQWGNTVSARLDWGYPIFRRGSLDDTWQNNGFSFSIIITPF